MGRLSRQGSAGRRFHDDEGAFPILSADIPPDFQPPSPSSKKGNKFSCALKALKCSSRAKDDSFQETYCRSSDLSQAQADSTDSFQNYVYRSKDDLDITLGCWKSSVLREQRATLEVVTAEFAYYFPEQVRAQTAKEPTFSCSSSQRPMLQESSPEFLNPEGTFTKSYKSPQSLYDELGINVGPSKARISVAQTFPPETIDEVPKDPEDENYHVNDEHESPRPISSYDTNETERTSNLAPGPRRAVTPSEAEAKLDALCEKYFNSPPRQAISCGLPLGDSITPMDSPADGEADTDPEGETLSQNQQAEFDQLAKSWPGNSQIEETIQDKNFRYSSLLGDISEEKKNAEVDDTYEIINDVKSQVSTRYPEHSISPTGLQPPRIALEKKPARKFGPTESSAMSSFSSVSSFANIEEPRKNISRSLIQHNHPNRGAQPTRHPFFWRSHPVTTVTSYTTQQPRNSSVRMVVPQLKPVPTMDSAVINLSGSADSMPFSDIDDLSGQAHNDSDYAPYLHPAAVRKLWANSNIKEKDYFDRRDTNGATGQKPHISSSKLNSNAEISPNLGSWVSFAHFPAIFGRSGALTQNHI